MRQIKILIMLFFLTVLSGCFCFFCDTTNDSQHLKYFDPTEFKVELFDSCYYDDPGLNDSDWFNSHCWYEEEELEEKFIDYLKEDDLVFVRSLGSTAYQFTLSVFQSEFRALFDDDESIKRFASLSIYIVIAEDSEGDYFVNYFPDYGPKGYDISYFTYPISGIFDGSIIERIVNRNIGQCAEMQYSKRVYNDNGGFAYAYDTLKVCISNDILDDLRYYVLDSAEFDELTISTLTSGKLFENDEVDKTIYSDKKYFQIQSDSEHIFFRFYGGQGSDGNYTLFTFEISDYLE